MHAKPLLIGSLAIAMAGCLINITDSDRDQDEEASEAFFADVDATAAVQLRLEGINGAVRVLGSAGSTTARITAERRVRSNSLADAEAFLARVRVEVRVQGNEILVRTDQPNDTDGRDAIVDYDLTIPDYLEFRGANVNGGIDIRSLDAGVGVTNVNGAVALLDVIGDVEVGVVNGGISADVAIFPGGRIDLATTNGSITLELPTSVSAMIEANVANGSINVIGLALLAATTSTRSVNGRFGSGDGLIELETVNGTITVRGR